MIPARACKPSKPASQIVSTLIFSAWSYYLLRLYSAWHGHSRFLVVKGSSVLTFQQINFSADELANSDCARESAVRTCSKPVPPALLRAETTWAGAIAA